jgi:hypothetical protein
VDLGIADCRVRIVDCRDFGLPIGAIVIGSDEGTELHVDSVSARVLSVDPQTARTVRLVNSSIEQLAAAITAYDEYVGQVRNADDEAAWGLVQALRQRLMAIDPDANADPGAWWPQILEQAQHGLL